MTDLQREVARLRAKSACDQITPEVVARQLTWCAGQLRTLGMPSAADAVWQAVNEIESPVGGDL